jgi:hypothetical protein
MSMRTCPTIRWSAPRTGASSTFAGAARRADAAAGLAFAPALDFARARFRVPVERFAACLRAGLFAAFALGLARFVRAIGSLLWGSS